MRELLLYTLGVAYLVIGGASIIMVIAVAFLWVRYWFYKTFPKIRDKRLRRKREKLIDEYFRSFEK